jgi:hypothetical protein
MSALKRWSGPESAITHAPGAGKPQPPTPEVGGWFRLLSQTGRHPKLDKNLKVGVLGAVMHLAPADRSGYEVCPMRSAGCTVACLNTAGFKYARKEAARIRRTRWFFEDRKTFMLQLMNEIENHRLRAKRMGMRCGIRLNGTSDIPWEKTTAGAARNLMEIFPDVCFMDYTKRPNRRELPRNYRLVFSRAEDNDAACVEAVRNGMNVAVVFRARLPKTFTIGGHELKVIDGDLHDWRYGEYDDYPNERVVVGLRAKGKGQYDATGFVVDAWRLERAAC